MEKADLSTCACVLTPSALSRPSSGHVSPSFARSCVVAKTGMSRIWLALRSFWVVFITRSYSCIAGRNFSCRSQILDNKSASRRRRLRQNCQQLAYNKVGRTVTTNQPKIGRVARGSIPRRRVGGMMRNQNLRRSSSLSYDYNAAEIVGCVQCQLRGTNKYPRPLNFPSIR